MIPAQSFEQIQHEIDNNLGVKIRRVSIRVPSFNMGLMVAGQPPSPQYRTEIVEKKTEQWSKLIGILFCMPTSKAGKDEVLPNLDYFHQRSALFVDFFCIGYGTHPGDDAVSEKPQPVAVVDNAQWQFSPREFNSCRARLEAGTKWKYSGETDLLLAVARKPRDGAAYIDYSCAIACNLEEMVRDSAIQSIRAFFEKIFQFGEKYKSDDPVWELSDKFGASGGGQLLTEAVLTLVPDEVRKKYKALRGFAIRDVSR